MNITLITEDVKVADFFCLAMLYSWTPFRGYSAHWALSPWWLRVPYPSRNVGTRKRLPSPASDLLFPALHPIDPWYCVSNPHDYHNQVECLREVVPVDIY